jgi:F-type H+-transporting ATPase subunit a
MSFVFAQAEHAEEEEEEEFSPEHEFVLEDWIPIELGPLDLSVNKAVVYLWLGGLATIFLGIWLMRFGLSLRPSRRQTTGESIYELVQSQIAESSLPAKGIRRWFPYVATLFLFVWVLNIIGFIPLPISNDTFDLLGVELPTFGIYAATANLMVTLGLALITFVATHVEGIRFNGVVGYFKSWVPQGAPKPLLALIVPLEVISQFMRLISLSVRLFANMLAGHMLILVMIGLIFIFSNLALVIIAIPVATAVYLFEVVIVVTIQAFVFALLSAIYIGGAIEPEH